MSSKAWFSAFPAPSSVVTIATREDKRRPLDVDDSNSHVSRKGSVYKSSVAYLLSVHILENGGERCGKVDLARHELSAFLRQVSMYRLHHMTVFCGMFLYTLL
jgi:hypothetical protein